MMNKITMVGVLSALFHVSAQAAPCSACKQVKLNSTQFSAQCSYPVRTYQPLSQKVTAANYLSADIYRHDLGNYDKQDHIMLVSANANYNNECRGHFETHGMLVMDFHDDPNLIVQPIPFAKRRFIQLDMLRERGAFRLSLRFDQDNLDCSYDVRVQEHFRHFYIESIHGDCRGKQAGKYGKPFTREMKYKADSSQPIPIAQDIKKVNLALRLEAFHAKNIATHAYRVNKKTTIYAQASTQQGTSAYFIAGDEITPVAETSQWVKVIFDHYRKTGWVLKRDLTTLVDLMPEQA